MSAPEPAANDRGPTPDLDVPPDDGPEHNAWEKPVFDEREIARLRRRAAALERALGTARVTVEAAWEAAKATDPRNMPKPSTAARRKAVRSATVTMPRHGRSGTRGHNMNAPHRQDEAPMSPADHREAARLRRVSERLHCLADLSRDQRAREHLRRRAVALWKRADALVPEEHVR